MFKHLLSDSVGDPRPSFADLLRTVRSIPVARETEVISPVVPDTGATASIVPSPTVPRVEPGGLTRLILLRAESFEN